MATRGPSIIGAAIAGIAHDERMASPRTSTRPAENSASPPTAVWFGRSAVRASNDRSSHEPRAADTPNARAGVGRVTTRPASWRPPLLSRSRGSESEPTLIAPVHSKTPFTPCAWMPVSQRDVLTIGRPGPGSVLPMGKFDSHPRPRIRTRSSALAGSASERIDSRY